MILFILIAIVAIVADPLGLYRQSQKTGDYKERDIDINEWWGHGVFLALATIGSLTIIPIGLGANLAWITSLGVFLLLAYAAVITLWGKDMIGYNDSLIGIVLSAWARLFLFIWGGWAAYVVYLVSCAASIAVYVKIKRV